MSNYKLGWDVAERGALADLTEFKPEDGDRVFYTAHFATFGQTYKVTVSEEQFKSLEVGQQYDVECALKPGSSGIKLVLDLYKLVEGRAAKAA